MQGLIIKLIAGDYTVYANNQTYLCKARGIFRNINMSPVCGDICDFTYDENGYGTITKIYPRKNFLIRPPVANIDVALIIMSTIKPNFDAYLVDKLIVQAEMANIKPIICISKCEFLDSSLLKLLENYKMAGYEVITFSSHQQININKILEVISGNKVVLCGQSAVEKSSLINELFKDNLRKVGDFSEKLGRGKHQTREVEFLKIGNGFIADTPGFSRLDLNISDTSLARIFKDFNLYAKDCKYNTCLHIHEPYCKVKEAVEKNLIHPIRYENYIKLQKELKEGKTSWRKK